MMTCRTVRDALPEYAAGRPVAAREQIAEHLSRCAACAAVERELRAVFGALSAAPQPAASDGGELRTLRALRAAATEASTRKSFVGAPVPRRISSVARLLAAAALAMAL